MDTSKQSIDTTQSPIKTKKCSTFSEFMAYISADGEIGRDFNQFYYRGTCSSNYTLTPSLFRNFGLIYDKVSPLPNDRWTKGTTIDLDSLSLTEFCLLRRFYQIANHNGIRLPYVPLFLMDFYEGLRNYKENGYRFDQIQEVAALAQHYLLPTRLLDWSDNCLVALFFAIDGILHETNGRAVDNPEICLWCLDRKVPKLSFGQVTEVMTTYADNPNINAQKGRFLYWTNKPYSPDKTRCPGEIVNIDPLDRYLENLVRNENAQAVSHMNSTHLSGFTLIRKITMPASEARPLAKYLESAGITKASLFPSLESAADETKRSFEFE